MAAQWPTPCETVAENSGTVSLICYINRACPFFEGQKDNKVIVFNHRTLQPIINASSNAEKDSLLNSLTAIENENAEGVFFIPKHVFRHNYIYKWKEGTTRPTSQLEADSSFYTNFDNYYEEIYTDNTGGVNHTRYKAEQSWIILESVFDKYKIDESTIYDASLVTPCSVESIWSYHKASVPNNHSNFDKTCDYTTEYLRERVNTNTIDQIDTAHAQMPKCSAAKNAMGFGNHWRLQKRTQLYRGEDFFFKFKKFAGSPNLPPNEKSPVKQFGLGSLYKCLDVSLDPKKNLVDINKVGDMEVAESRYLPINYAVAVTNNESNNGDYKEFNFWDQPYYIIELGMGDLYNHYFIIICQRANPIFVWQHPSGVSLRLSECRSVSGGNLLNATSFTMTVRNHLGKLVINFETESSKFDSWVIKKNNPNGEDALLYVPRGNMILWGGNQMCGFLFGPLQYAQRAVQFYYPPSANGDSDFDIKSGAGASRTIELNVGQAIPIPTFFSLPINMDHHLQLTVSELAAIEMRQYLNTSYKKKDTQLFTQDAQFIYEYGEGKSAARLRENKPKLGKFFYGNTIKELGYKYGASAKYLKDSFIGVAKDKRITDTNRRLENFTIVTRMFSGDHFFQKNAYPSTYTNYDSKGRDPSLSTNKPPEQISPTEFDDSGWFLPDCKTPILTQISIVSDNPWYTRWPDGTNIETGIIGGDSTYQVDGESRPYLPQGKYAFDATDHVLEYSDSWSEHDFYFLEHSGTIKFLLNPGLSYGNNITQRIEALQDKGFYIEIWARYMPLLKQNANDERIYWDNAQQLTGYMKLFTGLCQGGTIETSYGQRTMTCKIEDYSKVLRQQYFYNSPFFDGMLSSAATYEILSMAGFRENGKYDPNYILKQLTYNSSYFRQTEHTNVDGRKFVYQQYALPSGYNRLEQPSFKFADCSSYMDAISQMNEKSSKIFYFDQYGIAHHEDYIELVKKAAVGAYEFEPLWKFTTNPNIHQGQLIYNKTERARNVEDTFNHIKIVSNTTDMELLVMDEWNSQAWEEPNSEGFLGYKKTYLSQDGIYGSANNVATMMRFYRHFYRPPVTITFETWGVPLRALDTISVDGEVFRVESYNSSFSGSDNKWWMTVNCERWLPTK